MEVQPFHKASDFLAALRLSDPRWTPPGKYESPWIFRGQACAKWGLVPRAWRANDASLHVLKEELRARVQQNYTISVAISRYSDEQRQRAIEVVVTYAAVAEAVNRFVKFLDELGFPIPMEGPYSHIRNRRVFPRERMYMPEETYPRPFSVGLASHHGIATHVLDFTRNPLVAAFFAAIESVNQDEDESLAVWAVDNNSLKLPSFFTCPRNQNNYLHAQAGVFLYLEESHENYEREGRWPSLHESMFPYAVQKLTLPRLEARELLRLLWAEQITRAHLMPTYDNVAQTLCSTWRFNPEAAGG